MPDYDDNLPKMWSKPLTFGKYKGRNVGYVAIADKSYLCWAIWKGLVSIHPELDKKFIQAHIEHKQAEEDDMYSRYIDDNPDWGNRD